MITDCMTERLLQFIWQFQYYNALNLQTTEEKHLEIIFPGTFNTNQGPDFLNARIKIDDTAWAGTIELHINSADWNIHNHSQDKNYTNVILHVVWKDDIKFPLPFPTLELQNRVSKLLLGKFRELMQAQHFIPCEKIFPHMDTLSFMKWKETLLIQRLQHKVVYIQSLLTKNNQHWEETFWWMLARNLGTKINNDLFEKTAQSIPFIILEKHKNQLLQLEALLLGQAGLLDAEFKEQYPAMLKKEYQFLKKKYSLQPVHYPVYFLRMRPANFPTIRFAQLAAIIHNTNHLFDSLKDILLANEAKKIFSVTANDYWHYHYVFDEKSEFKKKSLGKDMFANIMINSVIPMLYAYGYLNKNEQLKSKALTWLEYCEPEANNITRGFKSLGIENKSAYDSQALIQLKNEYCDNKYCLECAIGNSILKDDTNRVTNDIPLQLPGQDAGFS